MCKWLSLPQWGGISAIATIIAVVISVMTLGWDGGSKGPSGPMSTRTPLLEEGRAQTTEPDGTPSFAAPLTMSPETFTPSVASTATQSPTSSAVVMSTPSLTPFVAPTITPKTPAAMPNDDNALPDAVGDIPGAVFPLGGVVSSAVDQNDRPMDVYALDLTAGQEIQIALSEADSEVSVLLANPGSQSFTPGAYAKALQEDYAGAGWRTAFVPAVSGAHYLAIGAKGNAERYTLSVTLTGRVFGDGGVASEIPGSPLLVGGAVSSVVDKNTKPSDVYAFNFTPGQEIQLTLSDVAGEVIIRMAYPGSESFERGPYAEAFRENYGRSGWRKAFGSATAGVHYLAITAKESGQHYTLSTEYR